MADHPHHHPSVHLDEAHWVAWLAQAELEGELLVAFVTEGASGAAARRPGGAAGVRRVVDVGSGPGVGTCELARLFPDAEVVALDGSPAMLARAAERAAAQGFGHRVQTHLGELPDGIGDLDAADLIWASMSLHHVGDEVAALARLRDLLAPDGVIALAEFGDPMRVLPDGLDIGRPGLAQRIEEAGAEWFAAMRAGIDGSVPSRDLTTMLEAAGFDVLDLHTAELRFDPPLSDLARQVVVGHIRRLHDQLHDGLDAEDLAALDVLADEDDPRSSAHRPDVFVATSRTIVIAAPADRRP